MTIPPIRSAVSPASRRLVRVCAVVAVAATAVLAAIPARAIAVPTSNWHEVTTRPLGPDGGNFIAINEKTDRYYVVTSAGYPADSALVEFDGPTGTRLRTTSLPPVPQYMSVDTSRNMLFAPIWGPSNSVARVDLDTMSVDSVSAPDWAPFGTALDQDTGKLYVTDAGDISRTGQGSISVVDTTTTPMTRDAVTLTDGTIYSPVLDSNHHNLVVPVGTGYDLVYDTISESVESGIYPDPSRRALPHAAAIDPGLNRVFVANADADPSSVNTVSVIDTSVSDPTKAVIATIPLSDAPAATPDQVTDITSDTTRHLVFVTTLRNPVATSGTGKVYVIDARNDTVVSVIDIPSSSTAGNVAVNSLTGALHVTWTAEIDQVAQNFVSTYEMSPGVAAAAADASDSIAEAADLASASDMTARLLLAGGGVLAIGATIAVLVLLTRRRT